MIQNKKAALVINPRTGQNVTKLRDVLAVLAAAGWKTRIGLKEYGGHSIELARQASDDGDDLVIAYGGDGTLSQVINGVMTSKKQRATVGLLPGGTANIWALETGIPGDPVKAALTLLTSETRSVDVGCVNVESITFPVVQQDEQGQTHNHAPQKKHKIKKTRPKAKHHFLLMAGLGMDAAIMASISKPLKYRIGPLAIGLSAAKEVPAQHPFHIKVCTTNADGKQEAEWEGEAHQVVIGNTRRYAIVAEMTPEAYVDDGMLDACVITAGDPLSTMQQISSLLLRRKPDNLSAEYFHGAHITFTVPSTVPLQLDGSPVELKDYLSASDYAMLQERQEDAEQAMVTYRFDALAHALHVAIPRTYDDTLFIESAGRREETTSKEGEPQLEKSQQQEQEIHDEQKDVAKSNADISKHVSTLIDALRAKGRKVTIVGSAIDPKQDQHAIIAGMTPKLASGELKPVALVIDKHTILQSHEGEHLDFAAIHDLQEGAVVTVEGKKSKRGVIHTTLLVI